MARGEWAGTYTLIFGDFGFGFDVFLAINSIVFVTETIVSSCHKGPLLGVEVQFEREIREPREVGGKPP